LGFDFWLRLGSAGQDPKLEMLAVLRDANFELVASRKLSDEDLFGKRVLDEALDRPLERPRAIVLVVSVLDEEIRGRIGELERQVLLRQPLPDVLEQYPDDLRDVLARQRVEDDRF